MSVYVCAPVTNPLKRLNLPKPVLLPKLKGLPKRSMVMAEQRQTVDQKQLLNYRCKVSWLTFLPSEKAFSYKMRLDAMKRQAGRPSINSAPVEQNLIGVTSRDTLAKEIGESSEQVRRYIRLTRLIPFLLRMVDGREIALRPAVEISYLPRDWQEVVAAAVHYQKRTPSHAQAKK